MSNGSLATLGTYVGILFCIKLVADKWLLAKRRERRKKYYNEDYLKSDEWKQKRELVLKRDGKKCIYCGAPATQVHHKLYAPQNIGKEPIDWLVSVCEACHRKQHNK